MVIYLKRTVLWVAVLELSILNLQIEPPAQDSDQGLSWDQHRHVNAGPNRTEAMNQQNIDLVLAVLKKHHIDCLDLTGGAPELNPLFKYLVSTARDLGARVIDRCNLTILSQPAQEDLATFLAEHQVEITASLPCYSEANVDKQRGKGVFERSIEGLQTLSALGYG